MSNAYIRDLQRKLAEMENRSFRSAGSSGISPSWFNIANRDLTSSIETDEVRSKGISLNHTQTDLIIELQSQIRELQNKNINLVKTLAEKDELIEYLRAVINEEI